jgi:GxxExxY protein
MPQPGPDAALTERVIGAAIEVHRHLGPGLLESAYQTCMKLEMGLRGIGFRSEVALPLEYKGHALDCGYRLDFLVDERVVVELKAVEQLQGLHSAQLLTYLRLLDLRVGLVINFNVPVLVRGIWRLVNGQDR